MKIKLMILYCSKWQGPFKLDFKFESFLRKKNLSLYFFFFKLVYPIVHKNINYKYLTED